MNRTVFLSDLTSHSYGSRTPSAPFRNRSFFLRAQPPLLTQEGSFAFCNCPAYTYLALCVSPTHFDRFDSQSSFSRRMRGLPRPGTGTPVGSGVSRLLVTPGTPGAAILSAMRGACAGH